MNTPDSGKDIEARWRTYLKGAAFLIPALSILAFFCVFLLPKLQMIWRDAGFDESSARSALHVAAFIIEHGLVLSATIILILVLLEWRSARWPRYRRASVDVAAFLVNTAVLVFITAMFMTALISAPALLK